MTHRPGWIAVALLGLVAVGGLLLGSATTGSSHPAETAGAPDPQTPSGDADVVPEPAAADVEIVVDGDRRIFLPLESAFLLPDDSLSIRVEGADPADVEVTTGDGDVTRRRPGTWDWAPSYSDGYADLTVTHPGDPGAHTLRAWRLVPREEIRSGRLEDYRVGTYPATPLRGNPIYLPPPGLVEITERNRDVRVSPRFRIGEFASKQSTDFPKYLILRSQLLLKLEVLLDAMADRGYPASSFHVMSGYRTPYYNVRVLGNARYSRHQWGGAADIFVDEAPRDGYMDDLNDDGRANVRDIAIITAVVDSLERDLETFPIGGAGVYRANAVRGPFVHIDVRGTAARW